MNDAETMKLSFWCFLAVDYSALSDRNAVKHDGNYQTIVLEFFKMLLLSVALAKLRGTNEVSDVETIKLFVLRF